MRPAALVLFAALTMAAAPLAAQGNAHTFAIADGAFQLDGKSMQIISGEMHFARIPREYWRQRLRMAKAMGLNTIATYVFWNYHEVKPGVWDFHTGNRDLAAFVKTAQEEGLWVILRPGAVCMRGVGFWWLSIVPVEGTGPQGAQQGSAIPRRVTSIYRRTGKRDSPAAGHARRTDPHGAGGK